MIDTPEVVRLWKVVPEARIVGGAVRDFLSGRAVADVDFASPLTPDALMARLRVAGIKAVPSGVAHGTVTVVVGGKGFEVTTLRRDVAADGRYATVAFTDDWREDARRRDFTINAMSATRDGAVHDYFGGRDDLAAGRVRFVGEAGERIREDFLRILRFFRFFARVEGPADGSAVAAIMTLKNGLERISAERVWRELKGILAAPAPGAAVDLMAATGVLEVVAAGADANALRALLKREAPVDPLLRVAALLGGKVEGFAAAKKLSLAERDRLLALAQPALSPLADDAALRAALAAERADILTGRSWLAPDEVVENKRLRERLGSAERPIFPLQGRDLLTAGVEPGPALGTRLNKAREWWLRGGCVADAAMCLAQALNGDADA